jgi:hypothetical protein
VRKLRFDYPKKAVLERVYKRNQRAAMVGPERFELSTS